MHWQRPKPLPVPHSSETLVSFAQVSTDGDHPGKAAARCHFPEGGGIAPCCGNDYCWFHSLQRGCHSATPAADTSAGAGARTPEPHPERAERGIRVLPADGAGGAGGARPGLKLIAFCSRLSRCTPSSLLFFPPIN